MDPVYGSPGETCHSMRDMTTELQDARHVTSYQNDDDPLVICLPRDENNVSHRQGMHLPSSRSILLCVLSCGSLYTTTISGDLGVGTQAHRTRSVRCVGLAIECGFDGTTVDYQVRVIRRGTTNRRSSTSINMYSGVKGMHQPRSRQKHKLRYCARTTT